MALSKWSGHDFTKLSAFTFSYSSSPKPGLHSLFRRPRSFPFAFSTKPLIHGAYAATIWCLVSCAVHHVRTLPLSKCEPPSVMNVSGGRNACATDSSPSTVVFAVPYTFSLNPQTYCEYVSRISKTL